jgi:hypothetical protein
MISSILGHTYLHLRKEDWLHAAPPPGEHLGLFWRGKKYPVFSPAAANKTLHTLKLFLKLGK